MKQRRRIRVLAPILAPVLIAACGGGAESFDADAHAREVDEWHAERIERLRSEEGWLSLVGLHWLEPGANALGSADGAAVSLPSGPARAGTLFLEDGTVRLEPAPGAGLLVNGEPAVAGRLKTDADEGGYNKLTLGNLRFYVVERGDRFGVRVKDPDSAVRTGFEGIDRFPVDAAWRIEADWTAFESPREISIATIIGTVEPMPSPGRASFTIDGAEHTLEPVAAGDSLWYIFRDRTSGEETYGAGRYLYGPLPENGKVVIDFNRSYNPPCAFTSYATCPLPPSQNRLALRVEAGEKRWGDVH